MITYLFPNRYFVTILKGIFLRGSASKSSSWKWDCWRPTLG